MAKIPLGARIPQELMDLVEKEIEETELSKSDIVIEALQARYGTGDNRKTNVNCDNNEFIAYLKEQIDRKDDRIKDLEQSMMDKLFRPHR